MNVDIRHAPAFAVARVTLECGEQVRAESGAMMATSYGVSVGRVRRAGHSRG